MSHPDQPDQQHQEEDSYWRILFYRWFIEHNPLYLLSAMLVLGGTILTSRGLAHDGSLYGQIGVAAIAEVYSVILIGGAALLMRVGQRRSAVMLALLTALYQCDLTLHTETCPNLGSIGAIATAAWLMLFMAKLYALMWAMKIRLSHSALATAAIGALGIAILPYVLHGMDQRVASALVMLWLFALSLVQHTSTVTSLVDLDGWGQTVRRRAVMATWLLWALLLSLHVMFWSIQYRLDLRAIAPVVPLIATRWIATEKRMWIAISATLAFVGIALPSAFSITAFLAAISLAYRAWMVAKSVRTAVITEERRMATPYRFSSDGEDDESAVTKKTPVTVNLPFDAAMTRRLLIGAAGALYLSIWTITWSSGPWPDHVLALDIALMLAAVVGVWRARAYLALAPLGATWMHFVVESRVVPAPRSLLEWGGAAIVLGFLLLIASLAASYWWRPRRAQSPDA